MSIADRITSMSNNLSNAYDGIEYLGVDTTGVDKNLQNLSSMLNVVYEGLPKVSDEGISPSIDGSRVGRLKSTLKASDTTQESTTGKNLFNKTDYTTISIGNNGHATSTETIDKITITTGAESVSSGVYITKANLIDYINNYDSANTYYVSMDIKANRNITMQIGCDTRPSNIQVGTTLSRISVETKIVNNGLIIYSTMNNEGDTIEVTNIMITTSSDTSYEPYTGGIPSPNPNYPQDIHVVKGNNTVEVCGKNKIDYENAVLTSYYGSVGTKTDNGILGGWGMFLTFATPIPAGSYTFSYKVKNNDNSNRANIQLQDINNTSISGASVNISQPGSYNSTFTTSNDIKRIRIDNGKLTTTTLIYDMQLELGSTATTYEPYNGTIYPINLGDIELCKINTYQDKLFKAVSGDTVYDSLTAEQKEGLVSGGWYKYGEVGKETLTGADTSAYTWRKSTTTDMDRFICDYGTRNKYVEQYANSLCNYFTTITSSTDYAIGNWRNNATYQFVFNFAEYNTTTLEQWRAWVNSNNIILYQPLVTPTITPITDTTLISQLEAWYKAQSKNGQTNVLQTNADVPFTIYASALKGE